jgi:OmpA-OmpF porin, OOP family
MSSLLDSLKGLATEQLVSVAAKSLGESEGGISKAIGGLLPSLLGGIMNSKPESHNMIGDLLGKAGGDSNLMGSLISGITSGDSNSPAMGIGSSLISGLFGDKVGGIANLLSNFAGIKSSSSSSLMGIGGSLIASFLGKKMVGEGLNFGGIMNFLGGHKKDIESAIPAGFSNMLGGVTNMASNVTGSFSNTAGKATAAASTIGNLTNNDDDNKGGGMKWLLPLLLVGIIGLGLFAWLKGCNDKSGDVDANATATVENAGENISEAANNAANGAAVAGNDSVAKATTTAVAASNGTLDASGNWIATKGEAIKLKLDNGTEIDATKGSLEDRLYSFIKDPNAAPGKDVWFNFEDLLFDTGKASLKASSQKQLDNTVAILKAYPNVKLKLGGYTDNTGDSTKNVKLSEDRAKTVHGQMLSKGLTAASFDAKPYEGYGPQFPVGDNSTAEGRGQNRRISCSVRAK